MLGQLPNASSYYDEGIVPNPPWPRPPANKSKGANGKPQRRAWPRAQPCMHAQVIATISIAHAFFFHSLSLIQAIYAFVCLLPIFSHSLLFLFTNFLIRYFYDSLLFLLTTFRIHYFSYSLLFLFTTFLIHYFSYSLLVSHILCHFEERYPQAQ